ncbi:MerR family transcriptional regulator [Sorangium sp. So ce269]
MSRSTLLYYESLGLIAPEGRSKAGYRRYGPREAERLRLICTYRQAGLSLDTIARLLESKRVGRAAALERRLGELNREIARLREQQQLLVRLLSQEGALKRTRVMNKARWVALLRASGLDEAAMERWHAAFERDAPEAHQDFLESLGIPAAEVEAIRRWSRERSENTCDSRDIAPSGRRPAV